MKKIILLLFLFIPLYTSALITPSVPSPSPHYDYIHITFSCSVGNTVSFYNSGGGRNGTFLCNGIDFLTATDMDIGETYTLAECKSSIPASDCYGGSTDLYSGMLTDTGYISSRNYEVIDDIQSAGMALYIQNSRANFEATTGFNVNGVIAWAGDNLLRPIIGMVFLYLYGLRFWLIVLITFSALIYFTYRAFRFYKH